MDKLKDMASKATGKGDSSSSSSSSSGGESGVNKYAHQGIDTATDKAGMGDKYDSKINDQVDKQIKNYQDGQK